MIKKIQQKGPKSVFETVSQFFISAFEPKHNKTAKNKNFLDQFLRLVSR